MKDTVTESWLTRGGIKYEYLPALKLAEIISDKVDERNIRLGAEIDDERVMNIAIDLENGAGASQADMEAVTRANQAQM